MTTALNATVFDDLTPAAAAPAPGPTVFDDLQPETPAVRGGATVFDDLASPSPSAVTRPTVFDGLETAPAKVPAAPSLAPATPEVDPIDVQRRELARKFGLDEGASYPRLVERWMRDIPTAPEGASPEEQNAAVVAQRQYLETMPELFRVMPDEPLRKGMRTLIAEKIRMQPTYTTAQKVGRGWERGIEGAKAGMARTGAGLADYLAQAGEAAQYMPGIAGSPLVTEPLDVPAQPTSEAEALREYAAKKEQRYASDPGGPMEKILATTISTGATLAPAIAGGVAGGPLVGAGIAAAQSAGNTYDRVYSRLIEQGFGPEEATSLAKMAATGAAYASAAAGGLPGSTAVSKTTAGIAGEGALEGAAYGVLQGAAEEAMVSAATGDKLDLSRVPVDALVGGGVGAAVSGGAALLSRGGGETAPEATNRPVPQAKPIRQLVAEARPQQPANGADVREDGRPAVLPTAYVDRMKRIMRGQDAEVSLSQIEAQQARQLEQQRQRQAEQAEIEAENREVQERIARGELPPAALGEVEAYNQQRIQSLEQQQQAEQRRQQQALPTYTNDQLRRMPNAKLRQAAEQTGVTYDARGTTIPRILDAQQRRGLEAMSDKQLWDAVRAKGLRAGRREQNIETLMNAPEENPAPVARQEAISPAAESEALPETPTRQRAGEVGLRQSQEEVRPAAPVAEAAAVSAEAANRPEAYQGLLNSSHFRWVLKKARTQTHPDGTVEQFFDGRVPPGMRRKLYSLIRQTPATHRDADTESVYNFRIGEKSYAIRFGAKQSTQDHIRVNVTDETVPAQRQAILPAEQGISPAEQAISPADQAAAPAPKAAPRTPKGFTKADLQRKLLQHAEELGEGYTAEQDAALEEAQLGGNAFTFHKRLPGEVRQFVESNPAARRLFRVSENVAEAGGEDAMAKLGDRYWTIAGNRAGAKLGRALEVARNSFDPEVQFLAALHDNLPPARERQPQTLMQPDDLHVGQSFEIHGHKFQVVEGEEGYRVLRDGDDYPVTPVDALSQIPVDKGSLKEAPTFFDPEAEGIRSRAETGLFGQAEYTKGTGEQMPMFHQPVEISRPAESAEDARIRAQYAEGEAATGDLFGKPKASGSGRPADRIEGPLDVEGRRDLLRAIHAAKGQLRAVLYDDGGLAVGDANALVHEDIIRATAGKRQAVARFLVQKRGNELVGYLTEGPASATQAPVWGKLGLSPDAKVDRLLVGSSDAKKAGAGGGRSFADRPEAALSEAPSPKPSPAHFTPRGAQGPGGRTLRPVQMPELVKLARELMGRLPEIQKLRAARGLFRPQGSGSIAIDIDTAKDPYQLAKTMSHEIGHLWDFLSDKTMKRGNLLARVKSLRPVLLGVHRLRGFLKNSFGEGGPTNKELRRELMDLSAWWRPGNMNSAYRRSSVELYADALSVLLNSPGELAQKAPKFFKALMEHLDRKPEVFEAYMNLQDTLAGTPESLAQRRRNDLREAFTRAEEAMRARAIERQEAQRSNLAWARQMLYDSAQPVTDRTHALVKLKGRTPENLAAQHALDELGYANNVNHVMLQRMDREVMQPVVQAGMGRNDLDEYLLLDRIAHGDRQTLANPQGHTPETAQAQLANLRQTLGETKWKALQQAVEKFHAIAFEAVEKAVEVGTYSREMFETTLKPNKDHYAAFGVVAHLSDTMPAGIKEQVGTFSDVGGPYSLTVMKTVALNRLNELQAAKNSLRDWLREHFGEEIQGPYPMDQHHRPPQPKPGREHLVILEDGKPVAYEVDTYMAKMFQRHDIGGLAKLAKVISLWTYIRHPLYIVGSPGFQISNPFRDFERTWVNLGALRGTTLGQLLKAYWDSKGTAWRRARGLDDATIERMLKEKALDTPFNRLDFNRENDGAYERLLKQYGILEPEKARNAFTSALGQLWRGVETVGTFLETVPKVAGFKLLEADGVTGRERSYIVRNYVGTPNLRRRGLATDITNGLAMYSNAFLQGARADAELATRPGTRSGWAMRRVLLDVMPKLLQKAGLVGLFGAGVKAMLEMIPSYDLANYTVIPLGVTGEGEDRKTAYLRIPHDETGRLMGSILWAMLDTPESGLWKGIQNVWSHGYGGLPSWSPMLSEAKNWALYLAGGNPTDFRNRPIIGQDAFTAGGWDAAKDMFRWQFDQFGVISELGRSFLQTPSGIRPTAAQATLERIPGLNRLLKISDRGLPEAQWEAIAVQEAEEARFRLGLPEGVRNLLKERYRLSRLGLEKLEGRDLGRLAALDEFYAEYLKRTQAMKAAELSGDNAALARHRSDLEALAKQTLRIYGPQAPQEQQRLQDLAREKVLRSDGLALDQQDAILQKAGIAPPTDLALERELTAMNQRVRLAGEAREKGISLLRQASAAGQKGEAATAKALKEQGLELMRQSRLSPTEESRHQRLQSLHKRIREYRRRMEEGTLERAAGEKLIDRLLEAAKAKPAA